MKAYVIAQINVRDQETYDQYRAKVIATIGEYAGKFLVRAGRMTVMEGEWPYQRTIVLEFASREQAEAWYRSPAYQAILTLRQRASVGNLIIIDGAE